MVLGFHVRSGVVVQIVAAVVGSVSTGALGAAGLTVKLRTTGGTGG